MMYRLLCCTITKNSLTNFNYFSFNITTHTIIFLEFWIGPTENIWSDDQCPNHGIGNNANLDRCKNSCLQKAGCTAINYSPGTACVLRACTQPVPAPTWQYNDYNGYYVSELNTTFIKQMSRYSNTS